MTNRRPPARPRSYEKKVGLVLQGGGALGRYQAGVYEALASSEYLPDWIAGRPFRRLKSTGSSIGTEDCFLTRHCNTWWIILPATAV